MFSPTCWRSGGPPSIPARRKRLVRASNSKCPPATFYRYTFEAVCNKRNKLVEKTLVSAFPQKWAGPAGHHPLLWHRGQHLQVRDGGEEIPPFQSPKKPMHIFLPLCRGIVYVVLHNLSKEIFWIRHQMKVAQFSLLPLTTLSFNPAITTKEVEDFYAGGERRGSGGFGSTGLF